MDEAVGHIASAIDRKGMRANTLFFFSSDNGGPAPGRVTSNGPLRGAKATLYEGGVRVPAFVSWQGHLRPATVAKAPLHMVDLFPTLLSIAGASLEQSLPTDGRDAWKAIAQNGPSPHDAILLNTTPESGAIRAGDWKLVLNGLRDEGEGKVAKKARVMRKSVELFNIAQDPYEKTNLATAHPEKLKELRARYETFAQQAVAPKAAPQPDGFRVPKVWGEPE
jgi:arylsulfatase A-like enzyme